MKKIFLLYLFLLPSLPSFALTLSSKGTDGAKEKNGTHGENIEITIIEENQKLNVFGNLGTQRVNEQFANSGEHLQLISRGGDGGAGIDGSSGMNGRNGIRGKEGRDGSRGWSGSNGHPGTRYSPNGTNGGNGGRGEDGWPGENGTDGTNGSNGQDGSDGGYAGNAGNITVFYKDSSVLWPILGDYRGGYGGKGGAGGKGGIGGIGGLGGKGGRGGLGGYGGIGGRGYICSPLEIQTGCINGMNGHNGWQGANGHDGPDGKNGRNGVNGENGRDGKTRANGTPGNITYIQIDDEGKEIPGGKISGPGALYHLKFMQIQMEDGNRDGIYQPGEQVFFTKIIIKNSGNMDMPEGGMMRISNTLSVEESIHLSLPRIRKGETYTIEQEIVFTIKENINVNQNMKIQFELSFRDLPFSQGYEMLQTQIKYPLEVSSLETPSFIFHDEFQTIKFGIKNISKKIHENINVNYLWPRGITYSIKNNLGVIPAETNVIQNIEISAQADQALYDYFDFRVEIGEEKRVYGTKTWSSQLLPRYKFSSSANVLFVYDGLEKDTFELIREEVEKLGLKYDIYDPNIEGKINLNVIKHYNKKIILVPSKNSHLSFSPEEFEEFQGNKDSGGSIIYYGNGFKKLKNHYYLHGMLGLEGDFYSLNTDEKTQVLHSNLIQALMPNQKLEFISAFQKNQSTEDLTILRTAILDQLNREYWVGRANSWHFTQDTTFIQQVVKYAKKISESNNPKNKEEIEVLKFLANLVPDLNKIGKFGLTRKRFRAAYYPLYVLYTKYKDQ